MKFSIVIPTFNEEKYLPILLESIKKQTFNDYEIIVADHNSPDKTRQKAKEYGAKIVDGNMPGPARNSGAKIAQGEWLIFLDADVVINPDFLHKVNDSITSGQFIGATTNVKPISKHLFDRFFFMSANLGVRLLQHIKPVAHGFIMILKKDFFNQVKGFNEEIEIGEDFDLAMRMGKLGKFKVLTQIYISVSVRRFDKEGRFNLFWKLLKSSFKILILGKKITKSHYDWGNHE